MQHFVLLLHSISSRMVLATIFTCTKVTNDFFFLACTAAQLLAVLLCCICICICTVRELCGPKVLAGSHFRNR
jgi:hypothetical protein